MLFNWLFHSPEVSETGEEDPTKLAILKLLLDRYFT
jgi:hypothetical protein